MIWALYNAPSNDKTHVVQMVLGNYLIWRFNMQKGIKKVCCVTKAKIACFGHALFI